MFVTLYSYNPSLHTLRTIYRDSTNPTFIDFQDTFDGVGGSTPKPPVGVTVSVICNPGTFDQYSYKVSASAPYATYEVLHNVPACGYVRPTCDLTEKSFNKTNETDIGANDGTANLFCTSSFNPIVYYCDSIDGTFSQANSTGFFTGLPPNDYRLEALDENSCRLFEFFTIEAFSDLLTHYKYRLLVQSANDEVQWELKLIDTKNSYLKTEYPKDITGLEDPIVYKTSDENEDKTTSIITSTLNIALSYTGQDFTLDEFVLAPEQSWKVELWGKGILYFQGWLLPDEIQDEYADAPYDVMLTASDGLASLKGNLFGDGSGGQGYGPYQIQQYGLTKWCLLVKQCLDQLGYDYGQLMIVSSLRFNNTYDSTLWLNMGCWADILYDTSGVPLDTYSALDLLLGGLKLSIFQHEGTLKLINKNDLDYINNGVVIDEFNRSFYLFSSDFSTIQAVGIEVLPRPSILPIGSGFDLQPCNPPQNLNYDKPYNVEEDINFNILALLYENPSFEIGSVEGEIPMGLTETGALLNAYAHNEPIDPETGISNAYSGVWVLRMNWNYSGGDLDDNYVSFTTPIVIDQPGQQLKLSFFWKSVFWNADTNSTPAFAIIFHSDFDGQTYYYRPFSDPPAWITTPFVTIQQQQRTTSAIIWNNFTLDLLPFPSNGTGTLQIRFNAPNYYSIGTPILPPGTSVTMDIDQLELTVQDSSPAISNQNGEKHIVTSVTGVPQANLKQLQPSLFTYSKNKRVAGNIFYGNDYLTSQVANLWNFALHGGDPLDRLPATITRAITRNYSRPMHIFEGDIETPFVSFFSMFTLKYYDGRLFFPFSIEGHLRTNIWHLIIVETDDSDAQNVYQYTANFEQSARGNGT